MPAALKLPLDWQSLPYPGQRIAVYRRNGERAHALGHFRSRDRWFRKHDDAMLNLIRIQAFA